jgi:hypothetical protein
MPRRQFFAAPLGLRPSFGLCPQALGQRPNQGRSPIAFLTLTARHSLASHPAAKPHRKGALTAINTK